MTANLIIAALAAFTLFGAGWFMLAQRKAADATYEAMLGLLVGAHQRERQAWAQERAESAEERADLLQRIQAPEVAVVDHQLKDSQPAPPAVTFDDDDGYWKSKEDLAVEAWREEVNAGGAG